MSCVMEEGIGGAGGAGGGGAHRLLLVVARELASLLDHAIGKGGDEAVHEVHGSGAAANLGADLLADLGEEIGELRRLGATAALLGDPTRFPRGRL